MAVEGLPSDIDRLTLSVYMGLECVLRRVASLNVRWLVMISLIVFMVALALNLVHELAA